MRQCQKEQQEETKREDRKRWQEKRSGLDGDREIRKEGRREEEKEGGRTEGGKNRARWGEQVLQTMLLHAIYIFIWAVCCTMRVTINNAGKGLLYSICFMYNLEDTLLIFKLQGFALYKSTPL